jgi:hypothetical protein
LVLRRACLGCDSCPSEQCVDGKRRKERNKCGRVGSRELFCTPKLKGSAIKGLHWPTSMFILSLSYIRIL